MKEFIAGVWKQFRPAFEELIVHLLITAVTIVSLYVVEQLIEVLHLDHRQVPGMPFTLSDWMFYLDVTAVTLINAVGIYRALGVILRVRYRG